MYAAYWEKNCLDIYRLTAAGVAKVGGGAVADLKPIKGFGKKLLIVGSANSLHLRKRYPAISDKDIAKAVGNEIAELFPIPNPSFHIKIQAREKMYSLVDIWAWDSAEAERIKAVFAFTHVLPEDLVYAAQRPEIILYGTHEVAQVAAYGDGKFLGSSSFVNSLTLDDLALFKKSLGRQATEVKTLRIFGAHGLDLNPPDLEVIREQPGDAFPFCLDHISRIDLGEFRLQRAYISPALDVSLKVAIGISLAYAFSLYLSMRNYDALLSQLDQKLAALSKQSVASAKMTQQENYSGTLLELEKKLKSGVRPLDVMELFAEKLPAGSFLSRLTVNEKNVEAYISSKEPLDVLKALGGAKGVRSAKLKRALVRDAQTGAYNFQVESVYE
jgi:hypothetical protein